MRLIDEKNILESIEQLKRSPWFNTEYLPGQKLIRRDAVDIIISLAIKDAPTIEPVKHGHWGHDDTQICERYICSECGEQTHTCLASKGCGSVPTNFCPNCGAKMDEEKINDV